MSFDTSQPSVSNPRFCMQDVCCMLDTKANTEDVNKVLVDVCNELEKLSLIHI